MKGTDWMHFYYGAGEKPVLVNFNGTMYTYVYSLQGDVVALLNSAGQVVVEYKYDAWGNVIGKTGSLVSTLGYLNPFRYRGYVYDEETGLYYLRSRYYKAAWGRFIGTDSLIYKDTQLFNINIFAYCANNPIGRYDSSGHWFLNILVGAAVNVAITFIAAKVTGQDYTWQDAGIAALAGAANAIPLFGPLIGGVISGVYTMHMASQHGATVENSIWVGLLAGTATIYSISNLAVYSEVSLTIGATAATDLVFGTGYNIIAAAVFKTVTSSEDDIDEDTIKEFYDFSKLSKKIPNKDHLVICTIY